MKSKLTHFSIYALCALAACSIFATVTVIAIDGDLDRTFAMGSKISAPLGSLNVVSTPMSVCTVDAAGGGNYTSIQAAVNDSGCTTINVAAGTYTEDILINRDVTINGAGPRSSATVVDGGGLNSVFVLGEPSNAGNFCYASTLGFSVTLSDMTITNGNGPGGCHAGGAIHNNATLKLNNVTISGNHGSTGGVLSDGPLTVESSTFSANSSDNGFGGALVINGGATIVNSTFSNNGGASTGGAIFANTSFTAINSTFAFNTAANSGGAISIYGSTATLENTIIAGNNTSCCGATQCTAFRSTFSDGGHNLDSGSSCGFSTANGSLNNATANLGPLQDNGGPTDTMALLTGSQAIDAADDSICSAPPVNNLDQRGISRPQGPACDIGAFELESADTTPPVTTAAPSPTPNASNWYNQNVTVTLSATDESGGSGVKQITYSATGAQTISQITVAGASTVVVINTEGTTTLSYYATDNAGNNETAQTLTIMLDKTAPGVVCGSADGLWHATDVNIPCTASDGGSGLSNSGNASFSLSTSVPANTETNNAATNTRQVCDVAGNCATAGPISGNKVDKKAPSVVCGSADGLWHATDVNIPCTASDGGSGLSSSGNASFSLSTSVPTNTETNNAATNTRQVCDVAGNCAAAGPISGNKVDKKAPTISISSPTASTYSLNQFVAAQYSCSDSGSGVATCAGTVANGSQINTSSTGTKSFRVTSTDNVGNGSSQTVTYTVAQKPPNGAPTADLAVSMTSDAPQRGVASGSNITYTITLRNKGPNAASGVALVDDIPTGTSFVSATGSYSLVAGGTTGTRLVVNVGTMNNGASVTVTLVVKVNAASGGTVTNSAVVSANTYDPVNGDNTAVISTKIR